MSSNEKAVVTVVGRNAIGILAKTATCIADANCSVVQVSQQVMDDFFTMNMLIDAGEANCSVQELEEAIKEQLPEVEIHVMHDNIFNAMHSI